MLHSQRSISPTSEKPEPPKRIARGVLAIVFGIALCSNGASAVAPSWQEIDLDHKKYALIKLNYNKVQYKCLNQLWSKESAWNPSAVNNSVIPAAYGIPQLRSLHIVGKSAYEQIDLGVKYILHRYGSPCKAWSYWQRKNWY